jgi:hypothetical protein
MGNQDLLKTFGELVREAQQHMTSPTTKNSVDMTCKGVKANTAIGALSEN